MKKTALFSIAVAAVFSFVTPAHADHVLLTPKAKEQQNSLKSVPGTTVDRIDRSVTEGTPKSREVAYSLRTVPTDSHELDLTAGPTPPYAPKDPRYETALLENAVRAVEVAPLK